MKKWLMGMTALFAASVIGFGAMGAAAMAGRSEQPVTLTMRYGEERAFSPVRITGRLTSPGSGSWWDQTVTFPDGVQTESRFHSGIQNADYRYQQPFHSRINADTADSEIIEKLGRENLQSGRYYVKDYISRYSYSVSFWEEDMGYWADVPFPFIWSEVGSNDYLDVEVYEGGTSTSCSGRGLTVDITPIRLPDGWYFTLPNLFHGTRYTNSATDEAVETIQYRGVSGIFYMASTAQGQPLYDSSTGQPVLEQIYSLPISSEGDTIVLRLDWVEEAGLFCLLTAEGDILTLRLVDPETRQEVQTLPLGPAVLNESQIVTSTDEGTETQENPPDTCHVRIQGSLLLLLQGSGTGFASRAIVVDLKGGKAEIIQNAAFETSQYYDDNNYERMDDWMFWQDGTLYVLEAGSYWSSDAMLYGVGKDGLSALGTLQTVGARQENQVGFSRADGPKDSGGHIKLDTFPAFRGWGDLEIGPE